MTARSRMDPTRAVFNWRCASGSDVQKATLATLIPFSVSAAMSDPIELGDQPIFREIVVVNANAVTSADPLNESPLVPGENRARRRVGPADAPGQLYYLRR